MEMHEVASIVICISDNCKDVFTNLGNIYGLAKKRRIPIIFLAEKGNDADETAAFAIGAVDYTARRSGTTTALINRIQLRIRASKHEKKALLGEPDPEPEETTAGAVLSGKIFLVAEDVDINREIISVVLSEIDGLILEFACDGKEAVEKFESNPDRYSLILMDVYMPVMDGLEATAAIRGLRLKSARTIPIIALTGSTEESEIEMCFKSGMNDYIEKPISCEKLLAVVTEHSLEEGKGTV